MKNENQKNESPKGKSLNYFVYTSGEDRNGQVDWGVKFFTDDFPLHSGKEICDKDARKRLIELDNAYTKNVARFGLSAGLDKHFPSGDGFGYIVLPWDEKYTLVGIYANYTDRMKRPNIGLIMVAVPEGVRKHMTPAEVISALLKDNNIREIAAPRHSEEELKASPRPTRLLLDYSDSEKDMISSLKVIEGMRWPSKNSAFILSDGKIQRLVSVKSEVTPGPATIEKTKKKDGSEKSKFSFGLILGSMVVIVLIIGTLYALKEGSLDSDHMQASSSTESQEKEDAAKSREFEELVKSVIFQGTHNGRLPVFGVASVSRVGDDTYEIQNVLTGKVPKGVEGKFEAYRDSTVDKPGADDYIVNPKKVKEKLIDLLSQLKYWKDYTGPEPAYYMTQAQWEQARLDIENFFQKSGEISKGVDEQLSSDDLETSLMATMRESEISRIAFFDRSDGIWQGLRIVVIDKDKNVKGEEFLMPIGEEKTVSFVRYENWFRRFKSGDQEKISAPAMHFQKLGILLLYGDGLEKGEEAYKQFVDQMIDKLVN